MAECTGIGPYIDPPAPTPQGGSCVFFVDSVYDEEISNYKLTKTAGEIVSAAETCVVVIREETYEDDTLTGVEFKYLSDYQPIPGDEATEYLFTFFNSGGGTGYVAYSEDDYPVVDLG